MESFALIILYFALSFVSSQSQYVFPNHYFINCGSTSDTYFTGKTFIRDDNPITFKVFGGENAVNNKNNTNSTSEIYRTARVFTKKACYLFEADSDNTFVMVNLHFSSFVHNGVDLSTSKFNVSVSGYTLLSNFNVGNSTVIKGFIVPIQSKRKFRIVFTPLNASSPAFVNAIEAFTTPSELFRHGTNTPHITPIGQDGYINSVSSSYAFYPVYRINVGGQPIDVDRDTLRRNWTPDDKFIVNSQSAETVKPLEGQPNYKEGFATEYDAPDDVYKTAKRLKANSSSANDVTWCFGVKKNAQFLVRAHFCDIISKGLRNLDDAFNFLINSKYKQVINLGKDIGEVQVPFYYDFVVDSFDFGFVNVSIGAISGTNQPVLLNGLEIMELLKNSGVVDTWNDEKSSKKVYVVIGCAVGGLVFVLLIGFYIGYKYRIRIKKASESTKMGSQEVQLDADFKLVTKQVVDEEPNDDSIMNKSLESSMPTEDSKMNTLSELSMPNEDTKMNTSLESSMPNEDSKMNTSLESSMPNEDSKMNTSSELSMPNEDSKMNTSLELSSPISGHLPSKRDKDGHKVNDGSI